MYAIWAYACTLARGRWILLIFFKDWLFCFIKFWFLFLQFHRYLLVTLLFSLLLDFSSSFSNFLRTVIGYCLDIFFSFLMQVFSAINFPCSTNLATSHILWLILIKFCVFLKFLLRVFHSFRIQKYIFKFPFV